jgi:polysaccharide export outer membrane protein
MLVKKLIGPALLAIVVAAGIALVAGALATEPKAGDKNTAGVPPTTAPATPARPEAPPTPKAPEGLVLPGEGERLPGEDSSAPAAETDKTIAGGTTVGGGTLEITSPAAQAPKTTIQIGGGTLILSGSGGGDVTITVELDRGQGRRASAKTATAAGPAHELAMRPLPAYRLEPPDVISIYMPRMVPIPPYRAEIYDTYQIHVANALTDQPLDGYFMVEGEGVVNLGPAYGTVRVKGMTLHEIKNAVEAKLGQVVREPEVSVQLAKVYAAQQITGQYLIAPDGTINLRRYGLIQVKDMTIPEAKAAVEKQLAKSLLSPELSVEVVAYNSKAYYVVTQGAGLGDNLRRFSITGNDTVLDAISQINGLSQLSSTKIWVARPSAADPKKGTILPVDWEAITQRGATATNYQILPGDRVFIAEDPLVALNNKISTAINPAERVVGFIGLLDSTLHGLLGDR